MELEVFLVSIIYWIAILGIGVQLHRRMASLREKISTLEKGGSPNEN